MGGQLGLIEYNLKPSDALAVEDAPVVDAKTVASDPATSPTPTQTATAAPAQPARQQEPVKVDTPSALTDSGKRRVRMTRMRKRIAERLKEAKT